MRVSKREISQANQAEGEVVGGGVSHAESSLIFIVDIERVDLAAHRGDGSFPARLVSGPGSRALVVLRDLEDIPKRDNVWFCRRSPPCAGFPRLSAMEWIEP